MTVQHPHPAHTRGSAVLRSSVHIPPVFR